MGISQIPTTAGTDKWVEIASSSPTSGSTVSFTSIPEYKDLRIQAFNVNLSGNSVVDLRFNNDSGTSYAWNIGYDESNTYRFQESPGTTQIRLTTGLRPLAFNCTIEGANEACKNVTTWNVMSTDSGQGNGLWFSTATINQIDLIIGGVTYSSGTIKLFGRN